MMLTNPNWFTQVVDDNKRLPSTLRPIFMRIANYLQLLVDNARLRDKNV